MADYVDAVHGHHFGAEPNAASRGRAVVKLSAAHEQELLAPLLDYLRGRNDVRLLGPTTAKGRVPTVAITSQHNANELSKALALNGIMAGGGDFYAVRLLKAMGVDPALGALRLSFVQYTSKPEVDKLIEALDRVL
jgi:selenocysteine lyase/cysteine desulfurase